MAVCYRVPHRFQVEGAKGICWERKFSKNKDGDSSFLPELQRRQNDNMAIPEIQYAVLRTVQRQNCCEEIVINVVYTLHLLFFVLDTFFWRAWVERKRRPSSFWLPTHQARCTGSQCHSSSMARLTEPLSDKSSRLFLSNANIDFQSVLLGENRCFVVLRVQLDTFSCLCLLKQWG